MFCAVFGVCLQTVYGEGLSGTLNTWSRAGAKIAVEKRQAYRDAILPTFVGFPIF